MSKLPDPDTNQLVQLFAHCDLRIQPFDANGYLKFIKSHQPPKLASEIESDGDIDLKLCEVLTARDLMNPLKSYRFPSTHKNEWHWILSETCGQYALNVDRHDARKLVYMSSLLPWTDGSSKDLPPTNADFGVGLIVRSAAALGGEWPARVVELLYHLNKHVVAPETRENDPRVWYLIGLLTLQASQLFVVRGMLDALDSNFEERKCGDQHASYFGEILWKDTGENMFSETGNLAVLLDDMRRLLSE